jgi:hypothetical protein
MFLRMIKRLFLFASFLAVSGIAQADLLAQVKPDSQTEGCPKGYPFPEDNLRLFIRGDNTKTLELPFCSSYGNAEATIERDIKGRSFVLLRYGIGRGTNVREEFLKVYEVGEKLKELKTLPISAPSGFTSRWFYDFKVSKPATGGLQLVLTLRQDGSETIDVPKEKLRTINVQ